MSNADLILILAFAFNLLLGLAVILTNPKREANRQFLILSLTVSAWLFSVLFAFRSKLENEAAFWIRSASVTGAFIPIALLLLRASILHPKSNLLKRSAIWLVVYGVIALYCLTPAYLIGANIPESGVPNALFGNWVEIFGIYWLGSIIFNIYGFSSAIRTSDGLRRQELQFVFLGLFAFLAVGVAACVVPLITKHSQSIILAPPCIIVMNVIIAYGIATHRILDVGTFVRRLMAYGCLFVYLAGIYFFSYILTEMSISAFDFKSSSLPHIMGALVALLTMSRAQTILTVFVNRLFLNIHEINLHKEMRRADTLFTAVTTTEDLLRQFTDLISKAAGTDDVAIFLFRDNGKAERIQNTVPRSLSLIITEKDAVTSMLRSSKQPILTHLLSRFETTSESREAERQLHALGCALAIGIHSKEKLIGFVVLGARLSGKVYSDNEQESLQILVNRFATALENAELYTEVQNAKIYNDILVDNIVSGILAINNQTRIRVVNQEAQRILNLPSEDLIDHSIEHLPDPIRHFAKKVLDSQRFTRDEQIELKIEGDDRTRILRAGGTPFSNDKNERLGILIVLHDITAMKELEKQVRHSDKLATIGQISASMAHEIKNPLVAIKTFTQLIPERSRDPEFIEKFSRIVGSEIERIGKTVSRMLSYSKPGESKIQPTHVHEIANEVLNLLKGQATSKQIQLGMNLNAEKDLIEADPLQLQQILVNLMLNACDATPKQGRITLTTALSSTNKTTPYHNGSATPKYFHITVSDTGQGIPQHQLKSIFDPFFTTKGTGTGLGLSLTYSLVASHGGNIEVESVVHQGTTFHLFFPLDGPQKQASSS